jgi:non-specific serine/threonine protein kinase
MSPQAGFAVGETVAHYRLLDYIGSGGMSVIYKAEDTVLGRLVALKFLSDNLTREPAVVDRFRREARTASALNHPNICTIHEIGEHEGLPFIVMEYLEGRSLRDVIRGHPLDTDHLVNYALQIASGLEAAHNAGVIHRDLKPANIFCDHERLHENPGFRAGEAHVAARCGVLAVDHRR